MKRSETSRLIVLDDSRSFAAEAYRVLRTNLHYANPDSPIRRLLVTSAGAGEGKSTTASNLAVCFAQADRAVLLVDADLRRPVINTIFRQPATPGLSSYLAGDSLLDAVIQKTAVPNLSIVASGPTPPNPAELVGSRRMREFLDAVGERFDLVLLDSPPVLAVSDVGSLVPMVDGVLLVVASGLAARVALRRAKEAIQAVQGRIVGAVLNRFDASAQGYSRRYYRPLRELLHQALSSRMTGRVLDFGVEAGIIAVLLLSPLPFGSVRPWAQASLEILVAVTAAMWVTRMLVAGRVAVRITPLLWPGLAMLALIGSRSSSRGAA